MKNILIVMLLVFWSVAGEAECFPSVTSRVFRAGVFSESQPVVISSERAAWIRAEIQNIYQSEFQNRFGKDLEVVEVSQFNFGGQAYITSSGSRRVEIYSGTRIQAYASERAYALVTCHEVGHHLGGVPLRDWGSVEGQADYFAAGKCLKRVFRDANWSDQTELQWIDRCRSAGARDVSLCAEILSASQDVGNVMGDLLWLKPENFPSVDQHSKVVVTSTLMGHPEPQCRIDTFRSGNFCMADERSENYCDENNGPEFQRPRCWYSPN